MRQYETKVGGVYYFRRIVPDDLRGTFTTANGKPRTEWKISTGKKDRNAARARLQALEVDTDRLIADARAARGKPSPDSAAVPTAPGQRVTLAEADAIELHGLEAAQVAYDQQCEDDARAEVDATFAAQRALRAAAAMLERDREDLRLIAEAKREAAVAQRVGIMALFDGYVAATPMTERTADGFRAVVSNLVAFLGSDEASAATPQRLREWRDGLRTGGGASGKPLSAKTINGQYLAAVKAMLRWAHGEERIAADPSANVRSLPADRKPKLRERSLVDAEALTILRASRLATGEGYGERARRWVPWVLAYSGARVNEITQARAQDVFELDGIPCIRITPEAGTVKGREARTVPLHPAVIAEGFYDWARSQPPGPLFFDASRRRSARDNTQARRAGSRLAEWVRSLGIPAGVQPNHGWRHRFLTLCMRHEVMERAAVHTSGHAQDGVSRSKYADDEIGVLLRELSKLPAVKLP